LKFVIYLHGFNSSPESIKAQLTKKYFEDSVPEIRLIMPKLPPAPLDAIASVEALIESLEEGQLVGFIGSSLGAYYSLALLARYYVANPSIKAVLINPAFKPYDLLLDYLGPNTNYYTDECYEVLPSHMDDLKSLALSDFDRQRMVSPKSVLLLTQTGDEVLDYQEAVENLSGAKMWIQFGGDHSFENYEAVIPLAQSFLSSSNELLDNK